MVPTDRDRDGAVRAVLRWPSLSGKVAMGPPLSKLRKPFIQLHILRLSKLIYFFYKRKIFDKAGNFIDIVSKYPVLFSKTHVTANKTMSKLQNLAAFKGAAKFNSLRCT